MSRSSPPSSLGSTLSCSATTKRRRGHIDTNIVLLVLAGSLCYFLNDGICYAFGIIYADLRQTFEQSAAKTAILSGMMDAVPQFSALVVCPFVETIGCGASTALGTIFVAVGFFSSAFVTTLAPLFFTIGVVSAVGLELVYVAALAVVAVPESKSRGLAVGLTVSGSGLGSIAFSYTLPALMVHYSWNGTFLLISGVFLNILVAAIIFYYRFDVPQAALSRHNKQKSTDLESSSNSALCNVEKQPNERTIWDSSHVIARMSSCEKIYASTNGFADLCQSEPSPPAASMPEKLSHISENDSSTDTSFRDKPSDCLYVSVNELVPEPKSQGEANENVPLSQSQSNSNTLCKDDRPDVYEPGLASFVKKLRHSLTMLRCQKIWRNNDFVIFLINEFIFGITVMLIENMLFDHLTAEGFGQWQAATCQALFSGFAAIGHVCWGVIADHCSVMSMYCLAQVGTALFIVLIAILRKFFLIAPAIALAGFFKGANETFYCLIVIETLSVNYFYTGLVLILMSGAVGQMIGTPLGGYVFDCTKSYNLSFIIAGCILGGFTILLFVIRCFISSPRNSEEALDEMRTSVL